MPLLEQSQIPNMPRGTEPAIQPTREVVQGGAAEQEAALSEQEADTLTVTADSVAGEILANPELDAKTKQGIKQLVNAGGKLLFDKEANEQLFDAVNPDDEVPLAEEVGVGAVSLMLLLLNKSQGNVPMEAMVPAGAILIAKALEFINSSGLENATDQTYSEAFEMFYTALIAKLDPEFSQSMGGEAPMEEQAAMAQPGGGLLQA